jgi:hypothetical protein
VRVILDAPDADDQPSVRGVLNAVIELASDPHLTGPVIVGVNDAGHGNVLIQRLRDAGIPCERWFRASCGLRKIED